MSIQHFSDEQILAYIDRILKAGGNKLGLEAYSPYAREQIFKEMKKIIAKITTTLKKEQTP